MDGEGPAGAQAELGIRCPHMPEDTFSHGAAHIKRPLKGMNILSEEHILSNCYRLPSEKKGLL